MVKPGVPSRPCSRQAQKLQTDSYGQLLCAIPILSGEAETGDDQTTFTGPFNHYTSTVCSQSHSMHILQEVLRYLDEAHNVAHDKFMRRQNYHPRRGLGNDEYYALLETECAKLDEGRALLRTALAAQEAAMTGIGNCFSLLTPCPGSVDSSYATKDMQELINTTVRAQRMANKNLVLLSYNMIERYHAVQALHALFLLGRGANRLTCG